MPELTDEMCLALLQAVPRDHASAEQALATLFARYDRYLQAHLSRWLKDADVADISQEVWQRVWTRLDARIVVAKFRGWIYRCGDNLAIDLLRRKKVRAESTWGERDLADFLPNHVHDLAFAEQLGKCMAKLPERLQDVVRRLMNQESLDEIAAATGIKKERIYQLKHEARRLLLSCMEEAQ